MYNIIKGIILIGLVAVTVMLGKEIYEKRTISTTPSLQEEAGKLLDRIINLDGVAKKSKGTTTESMKGEEGQSLLSQKKLNGNGPYLDEEDKELTRLVTGADEPASTTTPSGPGVVEHSSTTRLAGPSKGQTVNLEDGRVEKIESFYSKAASVLEGME